MNLLELGDFLLQGIVRLLDDESFMSVSRTCRRLNGVASSCRSWSGSLMQKRVERLIYKSFNARNQRLVNAMYESCCNAEVLSLNMEIISKSTVTYLVNELGVLGGQLFSLATKIDACNSNEVWPFCQVVNKSIKFELANDTISVGYVSLCDKQSSFNNHTRIKIRIKSSGSDDISLMFNSKPMGLLDSGILQTRTLEPGRINSVHADAIQRKDVLRPALNRLAKELGVAEHVLSFEFFTEFLKQVDRSCYFGHCATVQENLNGNNACLDEILHRTVRNRRKLCVEFLRTERERNQNVSSVIDYDELTYCLAKLAQLNGQQVRNIRLRARCIRDILNELSYATIQHDVQLLSTVISNIDLDSMKSGWACINPNLFTIWKEFAVKLGHGRHFKAMITWQEKRDRLNEYSISNRDICLVLQRKSFKTKIKMSTDSPSDTTNRRGSILHLKSEIRKLISRVRLRKTGLNGVDKNYLFIILMTILNE